MPEEPSESTASSESSAAAEFTRALLALERRFWKGDAAFYERHLLADAVVALPVPAGILRRDQIIASVADGPRWAKLRIVNPRVVRLSDTSALLTYRAQASREGAAAPYLTVASSAYVLTGGEWQLAFHQQTPEPTPPSKAAKPAASAVPAAAWGAIAVGACALGAVAIGTLAVGSVAIGRMRLGKVHIHKLVIDDLTVRQPHEALDVRRGGSLDPPAQAD